ncbi:hypothetical protein BO70DRAFT_430825 [Aspergillus heteromorphus CBS 117.55]|uniref:Uncharacterized protein n=1 Tax=Aspergillus heteromorphus CBS 117.55 TaxID=1448321 RepID=A0A317VR32_9EURO|nr:uncharacterized protein BO70DRAFT_430825 [Aspergillus heteromorphus CBS 117.55]PWY75352.1 hypothetical protein BO70DRAFT_430825 [Aspergillus heteromorphus CBS 117.55]
MYQFVLGRSRPALSNLGQRLPDRPPIARSDSYHSDGSQRGHIPLRSLRVQGAAWGAAGASMYATLHGVYLMLRAFRQIRYI